MSFHRLTVDVDLDDIETEDLISVISSRLEKQQIHEADVLKMLGYPKNVIEYAISEGVLQPRISLKKLKEWENACGTVI